MVALHCKATTPAEVPIQVPWCRPGARDVSRLYEADRALVARMGAADQRAFDEFFRANVPRLAAFATRYSGLDNASVEDIVQNTLVKAMRSLSTYRGEASLFTWLTQICIHELMDHSRKIARRPTHVSLHEMEEVWHLFGQLRIPAYQEPSAQVDTQLQRAVVLNTLQSLPRRYAEVLEAKYGDGLSVEEIAGLNGTTVTAVQSLLARAREAFKVKWRALIEAPHHGSAS
jgi:RNA polymerase sigma-70 factor, ECF subfamily